MEQYKNLGGDSGVIAYKITDTAITVRFRNGTFTTYTYTYELAGSSAVETMKALAQRGTGLNSYISTYKPRYSNRV